MWVWGHEPTRVRQASRTLPAAFTAAGIGKAMLERAHAGFEVRRPGPHHRGRAGPGDRRGPYGGVDEPGSARADPRDRAGDVLQPLAPEALDQGRNEQPPPARRERDRRLR